MIKGTLEKILEMSTHYLVNGAQPMPMDANYRSNVLQIGRGMGSSGLRVIALARGRDLQSLCYAGIIGIFDPPRVGCAEAIEVVQSAGVHVKMITGDSLETACSIGELFKIMISSF
jgi:Ca2+-transporting ATPase